MENDLSDNQRRFICRVVFLLVCALPTCAIVYFAAHQRTADQWAQLVQAELGIETSIGGVESTRPGEFVFQDVKLYDAHGMPIFESLKADVKIGSENRIDFRNRIQITRAGMSHFLKESTGRLIKPSGNMNRWKVRFHDLEIVDDSLPKFSHPVFHANDVVVELDNGLEGACVTLEAKQWGKFEVSRALANGQFEVEINTKQNTIPCWLAKDWFPDLQQMGDRARFSGIAIIHSLGGWSNSAITGNFIDVDLLPMQEFDALVLQAANSIQVNDLKLENARWCEGQARMVMDDNRQIDLNPVFFQPTNPPQAPFAEVIRQALLDDASMSAIH